MAESVELKACPLCGGTDIYVAPDETGSGGQWVPPVHVGCRACCLDLVDLVTDTREGAIAAWNRRVSAAPDGWVLVPREAEAAQMKAAREAITEAGTRQHLTAAVLNRVYRAMVSPAPSEGGERGKGSDGGDGQAEPRLPAANHDARAKHTPGPWEISGVDGNGQPVVRSGHYEVATCWHHCVGSIEKEAHANASLIAAAPDLLRACREVVETGLLEEAMHGDQRRAVALCVAAIAKAAPTTQEAGHE